MQATAPPIDTRMPRGSAGKEHGLDESFDVATPLLSLGRNSACACELLPIPGFLFGESVCFHLLGPCH